MIQNELKCKCNVYNFSKKHNWFYALICDYQWNVYVLLHTTIKTMSTSQYPKSKEGSLWIQLERPCNQFYRILMVSCWLVQLLREGATLTFLVQLNGKIHEERLGLSKMKLSSTKTMFSPIQVPLQRQKPINWSMICSYICLIQLIWCH